MDGKPGKLGNLDKLDIVEMFCYQEGMEAFTFPSLMAGE
jgi:hypothetical protein